MSLLCRRPDGRSIAFCFSPGLDFFVRRGSGPECARLRHANEVGDGSTQHPALGRDGVGPGLPHPPPKAGARFLDLFDGVKVGGREGAGGDVTGASDASAAEFGGKPPHDGCNLWEVPVEA